MVQSEPTGEGCDLYIAKFVLRWKARDTRILYRNFCGAHEGIDRKLSGDGISTTVFRFLFAVSGLVFLKN